MQAAPQKWQNNADEGDQPQDMRAMLAQIIAAQAATDQRVVDMVAAQQLFRRQLRFLPCRSAHVCPTGCCVTTTYIHSSVHVLSLDRQLQARVQAAGKQMLGPAVQNADRSEQSLHISQPRVPCHNPHKPSTPWPFLRAPLQGGEDVGLAKSLLHRAR